MVSLSPHRPLLPPFLVNHYPSAVRSVLLLLDSDWARRMWLWLIVMEWGQSKAGMARRVALSGISPFSVLCLNRKPLWVEQWSVAHAWQRRELFWIWLKFLFKFMHSRRRQTQLWSIKCSVEKQNKKLSSCVPPVRNYKNRERDIDK